MVDVQAIDYVDKLIEEYLLFRGFTQTLKNFTIEKKNDKSRSFRVQKIISQLFAYIQSFNIQGLMDLWEHLTSNFFVRLEEEQSTTVYKLGLSLKRYYVIYCLQSSKVDKVVEFFTFYANELNQDKHWRAWFALPYMKNPEQDPQFKPFFSKSWLDMFTLSLQNFLTLVFQSLPLPKILNYNVERTYRQTLETQLAQLTTENETLRKKVEELRRELESVSQPQHETHSAVRHPSYRSLTVTAMTPQKTSATISPDMPQGPPANAISSSSSSLTVGNAAMNQSPQYRPRSPPTISVSSSSSSVASNNANVLITPPAMPSNNLKTLPIKSGTNLRKTTDDDTKCARSFRELNVETFYTNSPVNCCKFSPNGTHFACGTKGGIVKIWPMSPINMKNAATIFGSSEILALDWDHKTGKLLFCATVDGKIKIWNLTADKFAGEVSVTPTYRRIRDVTCSPTDNIFACACNLASDQSSGTILMWNLKTLQLASKLDLNPATTVNALTFNHNQSLLVAGGADGMVRLFETSSFKPIMGWRAHNGEVAGVQFSYDETAVFTIGTDHKVIQWSIHNVGKQLRQYEYDGLYVDASLPLIRKVDIAFDSDGKYFLLPGSKITHAAFLYHVDQQESLQKIGKHKQPVICADWHPIENCCLTGSLDSTICMTFLDEPDEDEPDE
jgi:WD40 repeat protein